IQCPERAKTNAPINAAVGLQAAIGRYDDINSIIIPHLFSGNAEKKIVVKRGACLKKNAELETNVHLFSTRSSWIAVTGLRVEQEVVTSYPQVAVVRVPTPWVQSDSDITVLRHLEKMGCRLVNRPQAILNCVNKFWTFQELAGHGVPLPDTFSYEDGTDEP
uniref:Ribosomal modification protein rimK-like family member A n=1 Tax=Hucho hucho TaxID=62062 RepID=A0A4W5JTW8_9TELE